MKQILFLFFLSGSTSLPLASFTQTPDYKPKAVATPEVASLEKFLNIPASQYTGVANISMPLHTIKAGSIEIPIILRYHASGIQVEQEATWVGLGWDLTVGGSIVQVPAGRIDQEDSWVLPHQTTYQNLIADVANIDQNINMEYAYLSQNVCFTTHANEPNSLSSIQNIKNFDLGMPDAYFLNLPGGSAQFYLDPFTQQIKQVGNKTASYVIEKANNTSQYQSEWTIKDREGNVYFFSRNHQEFSNTVGVSDYYSGFTSKLSSITTSNGDVISFSYADGKFHIPTYTRSLNFDYPAGAITERGATFGSDHTVKYLSIVETETEKIVFELTSSSSDRQDLQGFVLGGGYGAKRLNAIHIWDKITNRKIKSIEFQYSYFDADLSYAGPYNTVADPLKKRLKLLSVKEVGYDAIGAKVETKPAYSFEYNEAHPLPRKDAYARDHWGYFNGQAANSSLLPNITGDLFSRNIVPADMWGNRMPDFVINDLKTNGQANRGMDEAFAKTGLLKKVSYPTGGHSLFEYEANRYKNYRTFSAQETTNGEGYALDNVVDMNTSGSKKTTLVQPDAIGRVSLSDFKGSFTRIDPSIHHTYFLDAWIKIWKVNSSFTHSLVKEWRVTQDQNAFNAANGSSFDPETIDMTLNPGEYLKVEAFLPDVPELTPQNGSLIPVATVSCTFMKVDYATFAKESIGGGLRIASIENFDAAGNVADKTLYKYVQSDGVTTSGKLMTPINYHTYLKKVKHDVTVHSHVVVVPPAHEAQLSSASYTPISHDAQGAVVGYSRVEEIKVDPQNQSNGKIVYSFRNTPSEILQQSGKSLSKLAPSIPHYDNGLVENVKYFTKDGALIKETIHSYKEIESVKKRFLALFDVVYKNISEAPCYTNCAGTAPNECYTMGDWRDMFPHGKWLAIAYPINTKWFAASAVKEINYSISPSGSITSEKKFLNYNSLGQLTTEEMTNSRGEVITTNYVYPIDVASPGAIVQAIKDKNLHHYIQSQTTTLNASTSISSSTFTYSWNGSLINLSAVQKTHGAGAPFSLVDNMLYDEKNNIIQFEKEGLKTAYIWDYLKSLQVAEVKNAAHASVAYTSFEADGGGGWTGISATNIQSTGGVTGSKHYTQPGFALSTAGLSSGANYKVTYWSSSGAYSIAGTLSGYPRTLNAVAHGGTTWTLYEHLVSGQTTITISGSGAIDELRLYPEKAQMTTQTYDPLIGITSQCDVSGNILYYEYDSFNRLKVIRDQDKNILKTFDYKYQQ